MGFAKKLIGEALMQIKSLRLKSYRSFVWNDSPGYKIAVEREKKILVYQKLRAEGCCEQTALEAIEMRRSTYYLWQKRYRAEGIFGLIPGSKKPHNVRKAEWSNIRPVVYQLRKANPCWGKDKIHRLLVRDKQIKTSVSTVGRVIAKLISLGRVLPVRLVSGKNKPKRKRVFKRHAKRWKYGMKAQSPGELVQIDHMTVYCNNTYVKHFKAVCPSSKLMFCQAYQSASSKNAKNFLQQLIADAPFPIKSIQVDGGAEFMKDFELECEKNGIPLFVLPPRSPKYNGNVERANGVTRDEFYAQYKGLFNIWDIRKQLKLYQWKYNTYRPHQAIDFMTPIEYLKSMFQIEVSQSNM